MDAVKKIYGPNWEVLLNKKGKVVWAAGNGGWKDEYEPVEELIQLSSFHMWTSEKQYKKY